MSTRSPESLMQAAGRVHMGHTCNDVVVLGVQELVNLGQSALHVPQGNQPQGCCGGCLPLILVLEDPVHPVCADAVRIQRSCMGIAPSNPHSPLLTLSFNTDL